MPAGLDILAWGNISPDKTSRYWVHLILAIVVVIWICYVFFAELRVYVSVRRNYLTSAEHRLRASATTVLVTDVPDTWLTVEALSFLYDVFPGGIRNIWINRDYGKLLQKVRAREAVVAMLESAETELIRRCKQAHLKQQRALASNHQYYATKEEEENADLKAAQIAQGEGMSSGNLNQVHQSVEEAVEAAEAKSEHDVWRRINKAAAGSLATIGKDLGRGLRGAEETIIKGAENFTKSIDETIETTNGFYNIESKTPEQELWKNGPPTYTSFHNTKGTSTARSSETSIAASRRDANLRHSPHTPMRAGGDQHSKSPGLNRIPYSFGADGGIGAQDSKYRWWKFWNGPSGGFLPPLPHGYDENGNTPGKIPCASGLEQIVAQAKAKLRKRQKQEYPPHIDHNYKEDGAGALWNKYIEKTDRSTHRIPRFGISCLPYICPWLNKKVDTIYWCREELARLNVEIEYDQEHSNNLPRANSAFIQFNKQVAAHMAAQAVSHHTPMYMAQRVVEVSPTDVIWDNMSIKWWESWLRTGVVFAVVAFMCLLWAIPVSSTALLGNIPELTKKYHWLGFLDGAENTLKNVAGILPAIVLAILKVLPPIIFYHLATLQGIRTGSLREPLYEHLPVTLEDEAVLRDEAFERAQAARAIEDDELESAAFAVSCDGIELCRLQRRAGGTSSQKRSDISLSITHTSAADAATGPRNPGTATSGDPDKRSGGRRKDVEAQKSISEALFSGYRDEIEDLRPMERDALVSIAFQHEALRATRPSVWVPQCDLGVSDQEVQRTKEFCRGNVWITNKGTALDK
ncbi:hypothetical protein ACLOAV_010573 [Pseudogymnoascus australis]